MATISDLNIGGTNYNISGYSIKPTSTLTDLSTFTNSTDLIYGYVGGSNTVTDKPSGVDAFGVLSLKAASG